MILGTNPQTPLSVSNKERNTIEKSGTDTMILLTFQVKKSKSFVGTGPYHTIVVVGHRSNHFIFLQLKQQPDTITFLIDPKSLVRTL